MPVKMFFPYLKKINAKYHFDRPNIKGDCQGR